MRGATRSLGSDLAATNQELLSFCTAYNIDVLCLTETGLYVGEEYEVAGYTLATAGIPDFNARSEANDGAMGVAILVRDPLSARVVHSADDVCEPRFASVTLANAGFAADDGELTVLCAYLPSQSKNARQAYAALATYVEATTIAGRSCIVAGDLNVHLNSEFGDALPLTVNEPKTHAFDDECSHLNLTAVNGVAALVGDVVPSTFNTTAHSTTVDYIMVPTEALDRVSACIVVGVNIPDSDHSAVVATVDADWSTPTRPRRRRQHPRSHFRFGILAPPGSADAAAVNMTAYHELLNDRLVPLAEEVFAAIEDETYTFTSGRDPVNATLDRIINELRGSAYLHVGGRTLVASASSWWTAECTSAKRARDNARRLRDNAPLNTPARAAAQTGYIRCRREYQRIIRRARKREHTRLRELLQATPTSSREWWRPFKGRKRTTAVPPVVRDDGAMATTAEEAAATLAADLSARCSTFPPHTPLRQQKQDDIDAVGNSTDPTVDGGIGVYEIVSLLTNVKVGKAAGVDGIPAELLRIPDTDDVSDTHAGIISAVHALFELIRVTGCVPDMFKMSVVTCLYKGRPKDARQASSYRPISVSTALSKLYGSLLLQRMFHTLDQQLDYFCCGSRRGRDIQELVLLTQHLLHADTGTAAGVLYADVRAAYDTCDRTEILHSLCAAGVGGWVFKSIEDSLTGTYARVKVNGYLSDPVPIPNGLPQGCVYGPILFNIMFTGVMAAINNVGQHAPQFVPGAVPVSSATVLDDVAVFLSADRSHRKQQLQQLEGFLADIGMGLNPNKSQLLSRDRNVLPSITVGGIVVPASKEVTYLGVKFSLDGRSKHGRANWSPDGERMMNCLLSGVYPFRYDNGLRRNTLSLSLALDVYRAQVLNPSTYACGVTLLTRKSILERLDRYAARGLSGILGTMWLCEPQLILAQVGILPAELTHMERRLRFLQRLATSPQGTWLQHAYTNRAVLARSSNTWMAAVAASVKDIGLCDATGRRWPHLPAVITVEPPRNHPTWKTLVRHHINNYADFVFQRAVRAANSYHTQRPRSRFSRHVTPEAQRAYIAAECYTPLSCRTKANREPYLYLAPKHIARLLTQLRSCASTLAYDHHLIVASVNPQCALCAAAGEPGVDESVPHFLFDCPALAAERVDLTDKLEPALQSAVRRTLFSVVGLIMADVWEAFTQLTPERRAAVVLGATLRDWDGYRTDYGRAISSTRAHHVTHTAAHHESQATVEFGKPPNLLNWNHTHRGPDRRLTSGYTPNRPAFCYEPTEVELQEFGALVWPAVWDLWVARATRLEELANTA